VRLNTDQNGRQVSLRVSCQIGWKLSDEGVWVGGLYQYSPPRIGGHQGGRVCSGGGILKGRLTTQYGSSLASMIPKD